MSATPVYDVPAGLIFQMKATQLHGGRPNYIWSLHGDAGGVHIHAFRCDYADNQFPSEWMGGIECHWATRPDWGKEKPDHDHCELLGKPCWHGGSSLYFREDLAEHIPEHGPIQNTHFAMLSHLKSWYRNRIEGEDQ